MHAGLKTVEPAIVLFRRLGDYAAVMAMSLMSRHPTEDGVFAQIKTIVVGCQLQEFGSRGARP
jgi:hypothetical protein